MKRHKCISSIVQDLAHASACNLPIKEVAIAIFLRIRSFRLELSKHRIVLQVLWSQELAYLTVVLEDSVTKDQIQRLDPPVGDFPKLDSSKQVDETKI